MGGGGGITAETGLADGAGAGVASGVTELAGATHVRHVGAAGEAGTESAELSRGVTVGESTVMLRSASTRLPCVSAIEYVIAAGPENPGAGV